MPLPPTAKNKQGSTTRAEQRRKKKKLHRSRDREAHQHRKKPSQGAYVCIDWGASHWRQFTLIPGICTVEPSLAVYDRHEKKLYIGKRASDVWACSASHVRFENLKRLFDEDSDFLAEECRRLEDLELDITIEQVLEQWWDDRVRSMIKRVDPKEIITIAVAHPAHFSPQSVQKMRAFFTRERYGRTFHVVVSEEATAALHGSRYSGFKEGDIVLVVDGGKSTVVHQHCPCRFPSDCGQDCACVEIMSNDTSLTTMIFATEGLSVGADSINQAAREHGQAQIDLFRESASSEMQALMASDRFEGSVDLWWKEFELKPKRDLKLARKNSLLDSILHVPTPALMSTAEKAADDLATDVKRLIERMIESTEKLTGRTPAVSTGARPHQSAPNTCLVYNMHRRILWIYGASECTGRYCSETAVRASRL